MPTMVSNSSSSSSSSSWLWKTLLVSIPLGCATFTASTSFVGRAVPLRTGKNGVGIQTGTLTPYPLIYPRPFVTPTRGTTNPFDSDETQNETNPQPETRLSLQTETSRSTKSKLPSFLQSILPLRQSLPLLTFTMLFCSILFTPFQSLAAQSGGRMGGSFSRQQRAPVPSTRSYTPRPGLSSYPRGNYGYPRGNYGYSRGGPNIYIAPPLYAPSPIISPFGSPGGYYYATPSTMVRGGSGLFNFLALGSLMMITSSALGGGGGRSSGATSVLDPPTTSVLGPGVSVAQVGVAVNVLDRDDPDSILAVLKRLSRTARTDSRVGVQNLVSQVALELLRQKRSVVAASSKYIHYKDGTKAQRQFNNWAVSERSKFERETVSKYGGVDYGLNQPASSSHSFSRSTVAVITLLVAIDGDSTKLPVINSFKDVEMALKRIASDAKVNECLQSAEILWTPEERDEVLTQRDIVEDYPELRSI